MKLLELIVKNVKREDIHLEAIFFTQDNYDGNNLKVSQFKLKPKCRHDMHYCWTSSGYINGSQVEIGEQADDATTTIITREELMRAYDLVEKGYTLWFGGDCPVGGGIVVDVVFRDGSNNLEENGEYWTWKQSGADDDIIAYRINGITRIEGEDSGVLLPSSDEFIRLISSVAPNITLSDALEIADTLIDAGYHK